MLLLWIGIALLVLLGFLGLLLLTTGILLRVCERRARKARGEFGSTRYLLCGCVLSLPLAFSLVARLLA
jgi:uncharacterized membrane protein HdeD (DUF308 family)